MENDKKLQKTRNNAYSLLRARPRSEFEMRQRLGMKGCGQSDIDEVIASLKRSGQIDDAKFARLWIESRMHLNPSGDVVLRHELKDKGINDSIIEAALEEKAKSYDEYSIAFNMASERFAQLKKIDRRKAMKRVYDFLLRRGFKYDTVRAIMEELAK